MGNERHKEIKKVLQWYVENVDDCDKIIGLMDDDIDPVIYVKNLKYFLNNSMDMMVLFMILRGRWANIDISDVVINTATRFIIEKWDENSLEEIAWNILKELEKDMPKEIPCPPCEVDQVHV